MYPPARACALTYYGALVVANVRRVGLEGSMQSEAVATCRAAEHVETARNMLRALAAARAATADRTRWAEEVDARAAARGTEVGHLVSLRGEASSRREGHLAARPEVQNAQCSLHAAAATRMVPPPLATVLAVLATRPCERVVENAVGTAER